ASHNAKPACMKNTRNAAMSVQVTSAELYICFPSLFPPLGARGPCIGHDPDRGDDKPGATWIHPVADKGLTWRRSPRPSPPSTRTITPDCFEIESQWACLPKRKLNVNATQAIFNEDFSCPI
ncbi:MAG: hypothetical protein PHR15_06045, partial [Atopobiaceae bacterium]|nr:hypothetical protein [Atopobiaceae bacterium]